MKKVYGSSVTAATRPSGAGTVDARSQSAGMVWGWVSISLTAGSYTASSAPPIE
jgi:hypothetical protein